jgi:hypothetical protein
VSARGETLVSPWVAKLLSEATLRGGVMGNTPAFGAGYGGSNPPPAAVNQSEARFTAMYRVCEANSGTWLTCFSKETKMKKLQYCVYVLYSLKDKSFYIGFTENLKNVLLTTFMAVQNRQHREGLLN